MDTVLGLLLFLLFLATIIGSFWGGIVLARRLVPNPVGGILLGIVFGLVFCISGCIALVAGCTALTGPPHFQ